MHVVRGRIQNAVRLGHGRRIRYILRFLRLFRSEHFFVIPMSVSFLFLSKALDPTASACEPGDFFVGKLPSYTFLYTVKLA